MGSSTLGKAATLDKLLNACIEAFDDNGELSSSQLPRTVLLMHRWYLTSTELAGKLLLIYPFRMQQHIKIRYWIVEFPAEFNLDLGLIHLTEEFRELAAQLGYDEHIKLIDISSIPSYDWMRRVTQRKKQSKKGKASLLFDHLEPMELAEHLTFLEYKSFRRISFTDYQSYVIHGCLVDNATLERSIALFNGISQWVQLMVLSKPTPQHRAEVITKFIYVAQLWGIIKQGYKCKDCGVNCHKQCKELLVLACRKLSRGTSLGSTSPSSCSHGSLPSSPSLPQCAVQDEVFKFPAVTGKRQDLDGRSITLMTGSARKISVRLQRATTSQATQTETMWHEQGWGVGGDSGSHTFPKMRYKLHGKSSKSKGFARWENAAPQAKPQTKEKGVTVSIAEQNGMDVQEEERQEPSEVNGAINWNI
ncbi:UNVERIFIED_CONTAM: hypothetical protein FKN15_043390 [Acipenser sinensis]